MYLVQHASFISYRLSMGLISLQMGPQHVIIHTPGTSLRLRSYDDPDAQGEYSQISLWQIAGSPMGHHLGYMSQVTQSWRRRGLIDAQAWTGRVYDDILLRGGPRGARTDGLGVGHTPGVTRTCEGCHVVRKEFPWAHDTPAGDSYLQQDDCTELPQWCTQQPTYSDFRVLSLFQTFRVPLPFADDADY